MAEVKKTATKKVFDIASTQASSKTPSIMIKHGAFIDDNQAEKTDVSSDAMEKPAVVTHQLTIQPLAGHDVKPEVAEEKEEVAVTADIIPPVQPNKKEADEPNSAVEKTTESSEKEKEQIAEAELEKKEAHQARLDSYVQSEKYFLPINQVEKRHNRHVVIAGVLVSVILAFGWVDIALDAGLITDYYKIPHTHFFSVTP